MNLRAYQHASGPRLVEGMTQEEACQRFRRKILHLARRTCEHAGPQTPLAPEDLVGYGVMGLLEAFERFDPARGADFTTFASRHIAGRMLDAVRSACGTTRRDRRVARELATATKQAREALGREPSHLEIADAMGLDMDAYWRARGWVDPVCLVSITEQPEDDAFAHAAEAPGLLMADDARALLREALERLPERDRQVVLLYYARDCSLAEIGEILDVTPSRVSQILGAARERMRKALARELDSKDIQEGAA